MKMEDPKKTKIAVTVDVIKSKDAVIVGSIIDVDSDDEYDEAEVYLKVGIPKPISPRVLKPKLTKIAKTTKTSVNFKGVKRMGKEESYQVIDHTRGGQGDSFAC